MKVVDAQVTFEVDGLAQATDLVLHHNGQNISAKRAAGASTASRPTRTEIVVDPKLFDAYVGRVGRYQLTPTFILTITRDGDRLFSQATGQRRVELFAESTKEYFLKGVEATGLVLRQNGVNVQAKRIE